MSIEQFRNLRELVTERLREAIALGELPPGQVLRQEALAAQLQVSRQPIREAVRILQHEGLIARHGRAGLIVAPLTEADVRDLYEFRAALERLVAERAASGLTATHVEAIADILAQAEQALVDDDGVQLIKLDRAFHSQLYDASENAVVREALSRHWIFLARAMRVVLQIPGYPERAWREHRAIFEAIQAGDVQRASGLSAEHAIQGGAHALKHLRSNPDELSRPAAG